MALQQLKLPLFVTTIGALFAAGAEPAKAQTVQLCPAGDFPKAYVRVDTTSGDPLRVRSTPAGAPVGLIPDGWAVRVLEWSRNGYWVKVTSHFGDAPAGRLLFGSAPDFREGWVSAGYVQDLGRVCQKPAAVAQLLQPEILGEKPVEVQGDWLAMGDVLLAH